MSEERGFIEGDVVEHRMNTDVFGIVIGLSGSLVYVRLSPTLQAAVFHAWELDLAEDDEYEPTGDGENVIPVDFTTGVRLDKNTKTRGVA
ncbi:hypothetical protein [Limoniibacter endophyticus]|uniref:Uncharacterized protein n=1 Tax=Limoniibacter endophyticus TaxID=1565040 RepID=A0A8J3GGN9_9HYPH|nr:hypothetical protein [Limoniibacter endophyticus]GHC61321.1 hypothetical protein GCM10010136_01800 [Limoniibacter endophyticus]